MEETLMKPIWNTDIVTDESVMIVGNGGTAKLLYEAEEILEVRSADHKTLYTEGKDYTYEGGAFKMVKDSKLSYIPEEKYYTYGDAEYLQTNRDGQNSPLCYSETIWRYQVSVTYKTKQKWTEKFVPKHDKVFDTFVNKLKSGEDVTIFFHGDSITYGASASSTQKTEPFMPTWPELVTLKMAEAFGYTIKSVKTGLENNWLGLEENVSFGDRGTITYINSAVGGWQSIDGINNYDTYIKPFIEKYGCDFFLLGYGMNDGLLDNETEGERIKKLVDRVRSQAKNATVGLLATMVPNPIITNGWYANQEKFEPLFEDIAKEYKDCSVIKMTSMSKAILNHKRFVDYTGNNVNHPNDFFARIYAQTVYETVIGYKN